MPKSRYQTVIADTSVLYYPHQLSLLNILPELYGNVTITPQVADELAAGMEQGLSVPDIKALEYISCQSIATPKFLDLIPDLGKGEASVLALVLEQEDVLVILDDLLARRTAHAQGLKLTGTVGVLIRARKESLIPNLKTCIVRLQDAGFFLSEHLTKHALNLVGEHK